MTSPSRIPPHNLDAERAVLGCILLEGRRGMDLAVGTGLRTMDFYAEAHRAIWGAMVMLYETDEGLDLITVGAELQRLGQLALAGGQAMLALLMEQAAIAVHLDSYCRIVIEHSKARHGLQVVIEAAGKLYAAKQSADEVFGEIESRLDGIGRRSGRGEYDPAVGWQALVEGWRRGLVKSGLGEVDELSGGWGRGDLVVIGGFTSHGKTAIATDRSVALAQAGTPVEVIPLEENEDQVTRRFVANLSGVSMYALRSGELSPGDFELAEAAVRTLQGLPLTVRGINTLRSADERVVLGAVSLSRADVIVLDHLRKVEFRRAGKEDLKTYAIGRFLNRLHLIAQRDGKVIVVLAQLSRNFVRQNRRPTLEDLLDSAAIEQAARQVWLLYWPWRVAPKKHARSDYEVIVAKNSEGGTGRVELSWYPPAGRFGITGEGIEA